MSYDINEESNFCGRGQWHRSRHHHGPPHGGDPRGHRGRFGGRHGLHSGRKFSSVDLQLILLALLEKSPSHGYELIKSLEELSDGFYVPSPGMIYPSLTYLEEVGHAGVEVEGNKKRYHLTAAGTEFLNKKREQAQKILDELAQIGTRMEEARRAFQGAEGDEGWEQSDDLRNIRHELRTMLRGYRSPNRDEDLRIVQALRSALSKIRREPGARESAAGPEALLESIKARRSMGLSRLKPDAVDRHLIERMLEAANWAPSHEDTEPWRFTVFAGEGREKLADLFQEAHWQESERSSDHEGARKRAFAAPVWISIGMTPKLKEDGTPLMSEDEELMAVAGAVQNLHLMAQAQGLAGMWHSKGSSVHPAVARGLGLEPPSRLLGFFMCGWPATEWLTSSRRPLSEKVVWIDRA